MLTQSLIEKKNEFQKLKNQYNASKSSNIVVNRTLERYKNDISELNKQIEG
jgi:hypothetical protein